MPNLNEQFKALEKERDALKANSAALRGALDFMMQRPFDENDYVNMVRQCSEILDITPEQCLNSVKAGAIEDAANDLHGECDGMDFYSGMMAISDELRKK